MIPLQCDFEAAQKLLKSFIRSLTAEEESSTAGIRNPQVCVEHCCCVWEKRKVHPELQQLQSVLGILFNWLQETEY